MTNNKMTDDFLPMKITIEYTDNTTEQREVGGIFQARNNNTYAVLFSEKTETEGSVEFIKLIPFKTDEGEDYHIANIESEDEYNVVLEAFNEYMNDSISEQEEADNPFEGEEVILMDSDGNKEKWQIVTVCSYNSRDYAVLRNRRNEDELHIFRMYVTETGNESQCFCRFDNITSVLEYEEVKAFLQKKINE